MMTIYRNNEFICILHISQNFHRRSFSSRLALYSDKGKQKLIVNNETQEQKGLQEENIEQVNEENLQRGIDLSRLENQARNLGGSTGAGPSNSSEISTNTPSASNTNNSGNIGGPSNTNDTQDIANPSNTSMVSPSTNINFDPLIMQNQNYNYLMDQNATDQDTIRGFKNLIETNKKNQENQEDPESLNSNLAHWETKIKELEDNILLRNYLVDSENTPYPNVRVSTWNSVFGEMQADEVRENREALADYAAEFINNPATSSFYQKPDFSQQEVEQQVERNLENEVIYPEPPSSVEEDGDSDIERSSVNDSSSSENYQVEPYSVEQYSSQQEENKSSKEDPLDIFEDAVNEGLFEEEPSEDTDSINNASSLSDSLDNKDDNTENTDTKNSKRVNDDDDDDGSNESGSNEPEDNGPSDDIDKSDPDNSINRSLLIANVIISLINCIFGDDDDNHHDDNHHL